MDTVGQGLYKLHPSAIQFVALSCRNRDCWPVFMATYSGKWLSFCIILISVTTLHITTKNVHLFAPYPGLVKTLIWPWTTILLDGTLIGYKGFSSSNHVHRLIEDKVHAQKIILPWETFPDFPIDMPVWFGMIYGERWVAPDTSAAAYLWGNPSKSSTSVGAQSACRHARRLILWNSAPPPTKISLLRPALRISHYKYLAPCAAPAHAFPGNFCQLVFIGGETKPSLV